MNTDLDAFLALHHAHANLQRALDDELGQHHGIGFADFALLDLLAQGDAGGSAIAHLAGRSGQPPSALLRQLIVLEKIGLVARDGASGRRLTMLRPAGRALLQAARASAEHVCSEAFGPFAPAVRQFARRVVAAASVTAA